MSAKNSKARISANARYNVKNYDVISFRVSKDECLLDHVRQAVNYGNATSQAEYMLDAIKQRLIRDCIIPDPDELQ